jgi:hypothetical protein
MKLLILFLVVCLLLVSCTGYHQVYCTHESGREYTDHKEGSCPSRHWEGNGWECYCTNM